MEPASGGIGPDPMNAMLRAAHWYAGRGWPVLPVQPRGKVPLNPNGSRGASRDVGVIRQWWTTWPDANVGIATGAASGLAVLDVDQRHGGAIALEALPALPDTPTVLTGGGLHYYFVWPASGVRNSAGALGAGLDVRGEGGYVVAPPSIHASGRVYTWEATNGPRIPLAPWPFVPAGATPAGVRPETTRAVLQEVLDGRRNETLTRIAGALRRVGCACGEIEEALRAIDARICRPPLGDEVEKIARSVSRYLPAEVPLDPADCDGAQAEDATALADEALAALVARVLSERRSSACIPTPWHGLNALIGGLRPGLLYVVGARPSEGKSTLGLALGFAAAAYGPVAYFSLEVPRETIARQVVAGLLRCNHRAVGPDLASDFVARAAALAHDLALVPLWIEDRPGVTVEHVCGRAKRRAEAAPLAAVVTDYLQLLVESRRERGATRERHVAAQSAALKRLARDLACPVVLLAQLNRAVEGETERRPRLSHLRESGAIEADADVVLLLDIPGRAMDRTLPSYSQAAEKIAERAGIAGRALPCPLNDAAAEHILRVQVAKQREGPTGAVWLWLNGAMALVENMP